MTTLEHTTQERATGGAGPLPPLRRRRLPWLPRPSRPVVLALLLAALLHLAWWQWLATSGGDMAAQDAWAAFARAHPTSAYSFAWYGGMHPVSYSAISPYLMATLGVRATMILAGTISAGLLAHLLADRRALGPHAVLPAVYGAAALAGDAVSGRVTFALGTMFGLAALALALSGSMAGGAEPPARPAHRRARLVLAALAAALAASASPVAGLFLGLVAAASWLRGRRVTAYALGLPPTVVVALSAWLFPFSGEQPMGWISVILPVALGLAVVGLAPEGWRTVRLAGGVYVVAVAFAWMVPSPIGTNVSRLGLLFGGVVLLAVLCGGRAAESLAGRRLGVRTATALLLTGVLTSTIWQVATAARDAVHASPPSSWSVDLTPLVAQLEARDAGIGRVEVVPTRNHREATALAPHVNLARGWNRQADASRNPIFYDDPPLTAGEYRRWLHRWAVRYVVLSGSEPDRAAVEEDTLVRAGLPYLHEVWGDSDWTLLEVEDPTPLVSAPAQVLDFDSARITVTTPRAARIVVRVPDSPWLSLVDVDGRPLQRDDDAATTEGGQAPDGSATVPAEGVACLSHLDAEQPDRAPNSTAEDWLVLHAPAAGTYRIAAPYKLPRGTSCS